MSFLFSCSSRGYSSATAAAVQAVGSPDLAELTAGLTIFEELVRQGEAHSQARAVAERNRFHPQVAIRRIAVGLDHQTRKDGKLIRSLAQIPPAALGLRSLWN